MRRRVKVFFAIAASGALVATAAVPAAAAPPAGSPAYKECGSSPTGRDHFTAADLQTANCDSQGTGQEDTGPVTNKGGNQPPGQQP
jgi:hypothetical protein